MSGMADDVRSAAAPHALPSRDAAKYLGASPYTLKSWRLQGRGPAFVRLSPTKHVYLVRDLDEYIAERRRGGGR